MTFSQAFDARGNRTALQAALGTQKDFSNTYLYDAQDRMVELRQYDQAGGNEVAGKIARFQYNRADQMTELLRGSTTTLVSSWDYGGAGRLSDLTHVPRNTLQADVVLANYSWSHDAANRITQMVCLADGTADYSYDARGQLTVADYDNHLNNHRFGE